MKKIILNVLTLLVLFFSTSAQLVSFKESKEKQKDFLHEFLKPGPGLFAILDYADRHSAFSLNRSTARPQYTIYDENLNVQSTAIVEGLKNKNYFGILEGLSTINIFYEKKKEVFISSLDPKTGQFLNAPVNVYKIQKPTFSFYKGCSVDSSYGYAVSGYSVTRDKHQIFDGVIFDKDMKAFKSFSVKLEDLAGKFQSIHFHQNAEGTLFITSSVRLKKNKDGDTPQRWMITEIDKAGTTSNTFLDELPKGLIENMIWNFTKEGISFTGLLAKGKEEGYQYIVSGDYNSQQKKVNNLRETEMASAPFWNTITDSVLLNVKRDGLPKSNNINSFIAPDGTKYLVMQRYYTDYTAPTYTYNSNRWSTGTQRSYGRNIYALSIAPDHSLNWVKHIPLFQAELGNKRHTGSIATFQNTKGIYIFYNDNENEKKIDNQDESKWQWFGVSGKWTEKHHTYVANITPDGTLTRSVASTSTDLDHHFATEEPYKFYGNELIFTSYFYRSLGKSTYKPSVFTIE